MATNSKLQGIPKNENKLPGVLLEKFFFWGGETIDHCFLNNRLLSLLFFL